MMKARGVTVWKRAARGCAASRLCATLACLAFVASSDCAAQGRARGGGGLPRVGTIKDYPATGLTVGCGNIYSHLPRHSGALDSRLVFISNSEGGNAWMNLDGRDVRLRQIKPARRSRGGDRPYNYSVGTLRVSVHFEELRPGDPLFSEDFMFKLRITLRRGRAARTVRAVGYADC